jgi:TRAP-type C4-dicarboxylate transport system substrate-binding protein
MVRKVTAVFLAAACMTMGIAPAAEAKTTLRFATLAPPRSPWGKVFKAVAKAVDQKTKGEIEIVWLWNGTAGPERAVVGKMKAGQLTGAAITATGLGDVYKPILALNMPGAFNSWADADKARDKLMPDFEKSIKEAGFYIAGVGDVGVGRIMSNGFPVKVPTDLKGKHPGSISEDIISPKIYEVIGGVSPVPVTVTELLPKLNTKAIDIINAPSLAAEQLQWTSRLDNINTYATSYLIGAQVVSQRELDKLTPEQRELLKDLTMQGQKQLAKTIRKEDDAAFERLKKKMTVHEPTDAERSQWKKVFNEACKRLKGAMPGDVLTKIGAC